MLHAARTVVGLGIVLQAAGLAKLLVIASIFGAGAELDAYYLALVIPTFLTGLSASILQTGFVPSYIEARAHAADTVARHLRNRALTWTAALLASVALLLTIFRAPVLRLVGGGSHPEVQAALDVAFVVLIWSAPLNGVADAIVLLLNAERRFAVGAIAPVVSVVVSVLVLLAWPGSKLGGLIWGLLAGIGFQLILVWATAHRVGLRLRPEIGSAASHRQSLTTLALPVIITTLLGNFVPAFIQLLAARTGLGAVSAMGYASRLHNSVLQAIVMSVSLVLLPHFAWLISEGRQEQLRQTLERVFAATLIFFAASLAFVAAGGQSAVRVLFLRGAFGQGDAELVAQIWLAFTSGLFGATWGIFLARLFQALRQPWIIAKLAIVSVAANVAFAYLLMPRWGVVGIAIANSLSYLIVMALFHRLARRALAWSLTPTTGRFLAMVIVTNGAAYVIAMAWAAWLGRAGLLALIGQFLIITVANVVVAQAAPLRLPLIAFLRK